MLSSKPRPVPSAPLEVIERMIDCSFQSKKDLLTFSLVARSWVLRCRYWVVKQYLHDLLLDSFDEIISFSTLVSSPYCTFPPESFATLSLRAVSLPSKLFKGDPLEIGPLLAFLQHMNTQGSLSTNLCPRTHAQFFPLWNYARAWTELSELEVTSTVPSLLVVASVILSLPRLTRLSIDVGYDSDTPVIPHPDDVLPGAMESLHLGPRGYSLLSWVACFKQPPAIQTVYLVVGKESTTPLQEFAKSSGAWVEYLTVSFHDGYNGLEEFSLCMPFFCSLFELEFQVRLDDVTALQVFVTSAISGITSTSLMMFTMYVPALPRLFEDEERVGHLAKRLLHETLESVEETSSTVCQRSWMVAHPSRPAI